MTTAVASRLDVSLLVECRGGGLASLAGAVPAPSDRGQLDMARWKAIVQAAVDDAPAAPVAVVHVGDANMIAGYRLYYLLRFAKLAGLADLTLVSDGRFWIDEATDWLLDSGVDRVALLDGDSSPALTARIERLDMLCRATGRSGPALVWIAAGGVHAARTIGWRGNDV